MSDLDRVLGRRPVQETTVAGDVPPVMTGFQRPRRAFRRKKEEDASRRRSVSGVMSVIGEAVEDDERRELENQDSVIPEDAEEIEGTGGLPGLYVSKPKLGKAPPDYPNDEEDQILTPRAALVAPDVTPDSMTEIDPSDVPGPTGTTFRAADAQVQPAQTELPASIGSGTDRFTNTMDTLLGRSRSGGGQSSTAFESQQTPGITPEAAAAMFSGGSFDPLKQGQPMPEPTVGDGKKICEAFRRFL